MIKRCIEPGTQDIMFIRKYYWENSKKAQVHIKPIMPIMQYSFHANYELQLVAQVIRN